MTHRLNPSSTQKSKLLDTYAAEAVAAGSFYGSSIEVPRGAENIKFSVEGTLFDRGTGDETYTFKIQTRASSAHSWADVDGCTFTTISATSGYEQKPADSDAPGVVLQRFIRVALTSAGTTPIATATIWMHYDLPHGPGPQYEAGYLGG